MQEDMTLHLYMDIFFSTIVGAPIFVLNHGVNDEYADGLTGSLRVVTLTLALHFVFVLQLLSVATMVVYLDALGRAPVADVKVWLARRLHPLHTVLKIHMTSFYSFLSLVIVYPILAYPKEATHKYVCPCVCMGACAYDYAFREYILTANPAPHTPTHTHTHRYIAFAINIVVVLVFASKKGLLVKISQELNPTIELLADPYNIKLMAAAEVEALDSRYLEKRLAMARKRDGGPMTTPLAGPNPADALGTGSDAGSDAIPCVDISHRGSVNSINSSPISGAEGPEMGSPRTDSPVMHRLSSLKPSRSPLTLAEGADKDKYEDRELQQIDEENEEEEEEEDVDVEHFFARPDVNLLLTSEKISNYTASFIENGVTTVELLAMCTADDYKNMGVSIGDRVRLQAVLWTHWSARIARERLQVQADAEADIVEKGAKWRRKRGGLRVKKVLRKSTAFF